MYFKRAMKNIQKLKKTPIIEALFEIRFSPNDLSVGEMLPGLLYANLRDEFPSVLPLPMANAPLDFREQNENLKYQGIQRLFSEKQSLQVGPRVVAISVQNYESWDSFKRLIGKVAVSISSLNIIKRVERCSFKYVNLLPESPEVSILDDLNIKLTYGKNDIKNNGLQIRFEEKSELHISVIHLIAGAVIKTAKSERFGAVLNLDTIENISANEDFFTNLDSHLESGHKVVKELFLIYLQKSPLHHLNRSFLMINNDLVEPSLEEKEEEEVVAVRGHFIGLALAIALSPSIGASWNSSYNIQVSETPVHHSSGINQLPVSQQELIAIVDKLYIALHNESTNLDPQFADILEERMLDLYA